MQVWYLLYQMVKLPRFQGNHFPGRKPIALHQGKEDTKPKPINPEPGRASSLHPRHQDTYGGPIPQHKTCRKGQPANISSDAVSGKKSLMTKPKLPRSPERTKWWIWAAATVCAILAISVIITGIVVFAIYMIYKPKMPYIKVAGAHLNTLNYDQSGLLDIEMALTILAVNDNFKAHASFSHASFNLRFHGIKIAVLQAAPFDVPKNSSFPIYYLVSSSSIPLDQGGMEDMDMALKQGIVPFRFDGQMRTRWKVGIFVSVRFWTHLSCELRFFLLNGTIMNPLNCSSRSH